MLARVRRRPMWAALLLALAVTAIGAQRASALTGLQVGYADDEHFLGSDADTWLTRAHRDHATIARVLVDWFSVAPTRPADPTNPADPAYHWDAYDRFVLRARSHGLTPLLGLRGAPTWAEGANRDPHAFPTSWRPDPQAFRDFAIAAARRYSGTFDGLPRVRYWMAWIEPNLAYDLGPQWVGQTLESAEIYRSLLNAMYAGVKSVSPGNLVIAGATAPFGPPTPGGQAAQPVAFWQALLSAPTYFDIWAHHPYGLAGGPVVHAALPGDVTVPDMGKIARLVSAAVARGDALPRKRKPGWVTEISWDSKPPDPDGVPIAKQARFVSATMYLLWREHISAVVWFQIGDSLPVPDYASTIQGGTYYANGRPKPSATAFRFPFSAYRTKRAGVSAAWGMAPRAGRVLIQRRTRGRWRTIARTRAGRSRVFLRNVRVPKGAVIRALSRGRSSLSWRIGYDGF